MNYFFALEVSEEAQQYIQHEVVSLWKPALMEIASWYAPEDYHVTLKFLGEVAEERQQDLVAAAKSVVLENLPFTMTLAPPGSFPTGGPKRVFWMGVSRNAGIVDLARQLDEACHHLGFKREDRLYTPHITVARYPRRRGSDSSDCAPVIAERLFPSWQAAQFVLMQTLPPESRANGGKARYNTVHTFPFGDGQISKVS